MHTRWLFILAIIVAAINVALGDVNPRAEAMEKATHSPIDFWGKVVDQDGKPVEGADVKITLDNAWTWGDDTNLPKINLKTETNGLFSLIGKQGLGLAIWVSKDGYYSPPDQCGVSLNYATKAASGITSFRRGNVKEPFPTEDHPTVFVLTRKGQPEANLVFKQVRIPIPKDGTPVEIDLATGRKAQAGEGDIVVKCWVTDNGLVNQPFPWKCEISVPQGGLQPRTGELDFHAPVNGYQPEDQEDMPVTAARWNHSMARPYFLHIKGDLYVRMAFWMVCGRGNFLNLEYYLNPRPSDRNLEAVNNLPMALPEIK